MAQGGVVGARLCKRGACGLAGAGSAGKQGHLRAARGVLSKSTKRSQAVGRAGKDARRPNATWPDELPWVGEESIGALPLYHPRVANFG